MPILIDLSQIAVSNIMIAPKDFNNGLDTEMIKHMIINSLRLYKLRFQKDYGEMVICCDSKRSWRKDVFAPYKANRAKTRDSSFMDWDAIYATIGKVKEDLKANFPYKLLEIEGAEADDLIATLAKNATTPVMVVSSDKDFFSLHKYKNVEQYSPRHKDFIKVADPEAALHELIIRGDKSDGIPNVKSSGDSFITGTRQKSIMKKDMIKWSTPSKIMFEDKEIRENYKRNKQLIDFNHIPVELQETILKEFANPPLGSKRTLMDYFTEHNMVNLYACISDF